MKKILSSLFMLVLFFVLAWAGSGWYFGKNAETELKNYLTEIEQIPGEKLFRAELLDYENTLFGANAKLKLSSDTSFLNERLGDFEIFAHMLNGPIFIETIKVRQASNKYFGLGSTRWQITIDELSLDREKREYLNTVFTDSLPQMEVITDFENKAHYRSHLNTEYGKGIVSGIYNLANDENEGTLDIINLQYGPSPNNISAPHASINYKHEQGITAAYKPGTTHVSIPELKINHQAIDYPLILDVTADAAIQSEEHKHIKKQTVSSDVLNGLVKIHLVNNSNKQLQKENQIPLDEANINLQFDKIPAEGFIAISEEKALEDNLYQQIQWTLEESAELPEGRDHIRQLNDQLKDMQLKFPETLANSLFVKKSQVRLKMTANNENEKSTLEGKIGLNRETENLDNVFSLLKGEAQVTLNKGLLAFLKSMTPIEKQSFTLHLQQGKLLLNN